MGSRGPLPKRAKSVRTAQGVRLRRLPTNRDAIVTRLARDVPQLMPADMAVVEDMARWVEIGEGAFQQLIDEGLLVTDTAHGNKEESRKNPLLIVMRTASEQIRANAQQLGATPMARARLPALEAEQLSLAEALFADVTDQ